MKSKIDRLHSSIENIEYAIKYCLKDAENKYLLNKMPRKEYIKLIKDLKEISIILHNFNISKSYSNKNLDEIRSLNLSNMSLYDNEEDYNTIYKEIFKTNNILCNDAKEIDKKRLSDFKKIFKSLSNFYQYRLRKAEKSPTEALHCRDKGLDNFKFITENYLSIAYNLKKVKYENATISNKNQAYIDTCTKIVESTDQDTNIKNIYINIKDYIVKYAKAEIILVNLEKMLLLCNEKEYMNIKEQIVKIISKYQKIYLENKENYDNERKKLSILTKKYDINQNLQERQNEVKELENLSYSISQDKISTNEKKRK